MMKENTLKTDLNDDLRRGYDFRSLKGGVRGKYYKAYHAGHTVKIHKSDGTTVINQYKLEDGAVMLDRDVREYFPDAAAVNNALRCLIPLMPKKRKTKTA
ncbi:hypothetical protein KJ068_29055 [bacterium]|nr:hypothetical protein [bacterium]NUM78516.1 hypothetical protein [candidate division KSB1 bacterium]